MDIAIQRQLLCLAPEGHWSNTGPSSPTLWPGRHHFDHFLSHFTVKPLRGMPLLTLCLITSCTLTSRLLAPIFAADGVLEAPSPFLSIRFPGHSENSFHFILLLYFLSYPSPPTPAQSCTDVYGSRKPRNLVFAFIFLVPPLSW
jgi:hypothetical protein